MSGYALAFIEDRIIELEQKVIEHKRNIEGNKNYIAQTLTSIVLCEKQITELKEEREKLLA